MSGDDDQPSPITTSGEVQGQLDGLSKELKELAASIAMLVKAITPKDNAAAAQSGSDGIMDPQTVPEDVTDPRRAQDTESVRKLTVMQTTRLMIPQLTQSRNLLVPSSSWPSG